MEEEETKVVMKGNRNLREGLKEELRVLRSASPYIDASRLSGQGQNVLPKVVNDVEHKTEDDISKNNAVTNGELMIGFKGTEEESKMVRMEQEIMNLRNTVKELKERERNLEMRLLEYYGLKEQDSIVKELENQLKISSMEVKIYALKIESLEADKNRLESQVLDYTSVVSELTSARAKIRKLKRNLCVKEQKIRQQIKELQERASTLREQNNRHQEVQILNEELRRVNMELVNEKLELERKLEPARMVDSFVAEKVPGQEGLEETDHLKHVIDDQRKEIEQLQTEHCTEVEELVYLKWINACLRYELRNYQAPPGKTMARDLSMAMSPKSELKAKQLILEYANSGVNDNKVSFSPEDVNSDYYCSSSQTSPLTESGKFDNSLRNGASGKSKFLSKLKKLVLGKVSLLDRRRNSVSFGSSDNMRTYPYDSVSSENTPVSHQHFTGTQSFLESHGSLMALMEAENQINNVGRPRNLSLDETRPLEADAQHFIDLPHHNHSDYEPDMTDQKLQLMKYARALKNSSEKSKLHLRSASFSSC
ncbi:hypothetical protein QJS10_CPB20g00404 [Acorus calamus]|uniref:Uncharacterized protein n=1 Tax=Acorus calamus TaxID=4465 RepID=A0AAV9CC02_ACOCL|nr:hypothetical protein QJS10_CPB20g00404 [Acorus calamus]